MTLESFPRTEGDYGGRRTYEAYGVEYIQHTNTRLPSEDSESSRMANNLAIYAGLVTKRLAVTDADERVATGIYGQKEEAHIAIYVHPDAANDIFGLQSEVNRMLGGKRSKLSDWYHSPEDRILKSHEVSDALDTAFMSERFSHLGDIVEKLRPRTI